MSQRSSDSEQETSARPAPANAIGEERILDAAYELLLAIGMRRMTMADIARHAEVSRATLYRRWPNVQAVVAALMTREWTTALVSAFQPDAADGRSRLVEGVVEVVAKTRVHPLMRKIIELDPEFLTPYLLERRGSSTVAHLALVEEGIRQGQADGSIRTRELDWLDTTGAVDVLVIGGGVTGAGVALDAAARGLSVALVEKHDLAFGTSRWSSKLVHGGLRYLASGHVGIARESAVERHVLMTTVAPHLVRPLASVVPVLPSLPRTLRPMIRAGYAAADVLRASAGTPSTLLPPARR